MSEVFDLELRLDLLRRRFEEAKNNIFVLEAVRLAFAHEHMPPLWAREALGTGLQKYLFAEGQVELEVAFDLKRGAGAPTAWGEMQLEQRNRRLTTFVAALEFVGFTHGQACNALAALLERWPDAMLFKMGPFSEDLLSISITSAGIRKAMKTVKQDLDHARASIERRGISEQNQRAMLKDLFLSEIPRRVRDRLPGSGAN